MGLSPVSLKLPRFESKLILNKVTVWVDGLVLIMRQTCGEASVVHLNAPGTVTSCSKWKYYQDTKAPMEFMGKTYRADSKVVNSCWFVLAQEDITPEQFLEWNPSLDSGLARCALQPGLRYCVKKRSKLSSGESDCAFSRRYQANRL